MMEVPVLIPKLFNHPFTYLKKHSSESLNQGDLVLVPFGKKEIGVVWDEFKKQREKLS